MSAQAQKEERVVQVQKTTADKKTQEKLYAVVFVWITFVILYLAVSSGNETFMWAALGLTVVANGLLYLKN